ncbi:hypothetical protein O4H26_00700 [Aequorivita viscosa]|nr:hypothetical protein [Aequorivita viscosa]
MVSKSSAIGRRRGQKEFNEPGRKMVNEGGNSGRFFKYQFLVFLIFLILPFNKVSAQDLKMCGYQGYQTVEEVNSACELHHAQMALGESDHAIGVVDEILDKIGLFRNFLIEECIDINNALAVTMPLANGDLERYILYDRIFFSKVKASTGTDWGLTSILAHEVGHHLNGHTIKSSGSTHKIELQADEFSGFVLARMGCSLKNAQSAIYELLPEEASATHPAKKDRLNAVAKGWNRGKSKTIEIKKIEETTVQDDITPQMILGKYIESIGGETRIKTIKTLSQYNKSSSVFRGINPVTKDSTYQRFESTSATDYFNPLISRTEFENPKNTIIVNLSGVFNKAPYTQGKWQKVKVDAKNIEKNPPSYIEEYAWFINNTPLTYEGIEEKEGNSFYVISKLTNTEKEISDKYQHQKIKAQEQKKIFFDVKTGLKKYVQATTATTIKTTDHQGREMITTYNGKTLTNIRKYETYNGILLISHQKMTTTSEAISTEYASGYDESIQGIKETPGGSSTITNIISYKINPDLDPENFKVLDFQ